MKKLTYKIVINYKKKTYPDGMQPVQLYISVNRQTKIIGTGIYIEPIYFDAAKQCIVKHRDASYLNSKLQAIVNRVREIEIDALRNNKPLTIDLFTDNDTPINSATSFIDYISANINTDTSFTSAGTRRHHTALVTILTRAKLTSFNDINLKSIESFDNHLRDQSLSQVTISTYHKRVKRWINHAIRHNINIIDPYTNFKIKQAETKTRRYLTPEELLKLTSANLTTKLEKVRDIFLFVCYTGFSFSDAMKLKDSNIFTENSEAFIHTYRDKTKVDSTIMLLPIALAIIEKYKRETHGYLLPRISLTNYNLFLKDVAFIAEINTRLTSHVARHTFATTVCLAHGVPIETVSKMLGHKEIKTTQIYAKVMRTKVANDMTNLREKLK